MKYGRTEYGSVWHELEPAFFAKETGWTLTMCGIGRVAGTVDIPIGLPVCSNCLLSDGSVSRDAAGMEGMR